MKKYIFIPGVSALFWCLLLLNSCVKDRSITPSSNTSEADFFKNEIEFRQAVISIYAKMTDWYWYNSGGFVHDISLLPGDDITTDVSAHSAFELFSGGLNTTNGHVDYYFSSSYRIIQYTNVVIEKVNQADPQSFPNADFLKYNKGEALFIRALTYFNLFNRYGSAPLVTERITERDKTNTPLSQGTQLLDQVISDLKEAATLLPASWDENNRGRAFKSSAYGLLVKALVFRGDYTKNNADYTEAIAAYNNITDRSLTANYTDNFSVFTENNSESLFEFQSSKGSGESNPFLSNDGPWRGVESMSAFWGFYTVANTPASQWIGGENWKVTRKLFNKFGTDPRLAFYTEADRSYTKYGKEGLDQLANDYYNQSLNNPRILRYADVKLLAAEAILKSGGSKAQAIGLINEVRERARKWGQTANIGDGTLPVALDVNESDNAKILQWIMDEKFVELCGEEGIRWYDLKRWDAHGDISLQGWDGNDEHFSTDLSSVFQFQYPKHLLMPIPQAEVERNTAITSNNPGY